MNKFTQLVSDIGKLWAKYGSLYISGIEKTLILALVATVIGCIIGFICGVLNTIPLRKNDSPVKRFFVGLVRVIVRIYVEVFRGTPMMLQAVFIYYGLPYFTNNAVTFQSEWTAAILVVSVNTGAYMAESVRGGIISIDPRPDRGRKGHRHDPRADDDERDTPAGAAQHHAADRQQLHHKRQGHVRDVHNRFFRVLFAAHRAAVGASYLYFPSATVEMVGYLTMTLLPRSCCGLLKRSWTAAEAMSLQKRGISSSWLPGPTATPTTAHPLTSAARNSTKGAAPRQKHIRERREMTWQKLYCR